MAANRSSAVDGSADELVLAFDAGGTKTEACLVKSLGGGKFHILGRGRSTCGNPLSAGFDAATRAIQEAISGAHAEAERPLGVAAKAVLSIAGAANPEVANKIVIWAQATKLAQQVAVASDVLPILAACSDDFTGIALIAGTGSVAFGRAGDGHTVRCGGWGYLLGDEGSGYALGRAALRLALHSLEIGDSNRSLLVAEVLKQFPSRAPVELARLIYGSDSPRTKIASAAPIVTRLADAGDQEANIIISEAATDLAQLIARTAKLLTIEQAPFSLALSGGVLMNSASLRAALQQELTAAQLQTKTKIVTDPLDGCLRLADADPSGNLLEWHTAVKS